MKKYTVFLSKEIRRASDNGEFEGYTLPMRHIMAAVSFIVEMSVTGIMPTPLSRVVGGDDMIDILDTAEDVTLRARHSHRIEFHLFIGTMGPAAIGAHVNFFDARGVHALELEAAADSDGIRYIRHVRGMDR